MNNITTHTKYPLLTPEALLREISPSVQTDTNIAHARNTIRNIIQGQDKRLLVIVGPCSIHDVNAALEYADLLRKATHRLQNDLYIVMRVYFEKPRTTLGWKGLLSDPHLNGQFDINTGLRLARKLLLDLTILGIPTATEFLDTMVPHYLQDLITWNAVGARTSASPLYRELASGLPMPVGFKNTIDGNIGIAVDAVKVAQHAHHYFSMASNGASEILHTQGNDACHIILRGSHHEPNFQHHHVSHAIKLLQESQLTPKLMIDCSHGNSMKNYLLQQTVVESVIEQIQNGSNAIAGVMLESNLVSGKQSVELNQPLIYGKSITDACLSWQETLPLLEKLAYAKHSVKKNIFELSVTN